MSIPILDKKTEVKRKAVQAIGSSLVTVLAQLLTLFGLGLVQAFPVVFSSLIPIWVPFLKYAFGIDNGNNKQGKQK